MNELWEWVVALDSWDFCDPWPLATLIIKEEIPLEFRKALSDIVCGNRNPNKKAAAKLKIPASERMRIAASISTICGLIDIFKYDAIYSEGRGVIGYGAAKGREPLEVLRELEAEQKSEIQLASVELNVSVETVENLLRDLRRKIEIWPVV